MAKVATNGEDWLPGTEESDMIYAKDGDDHTYGKGGDDEIYNGAGNDESYGGDGNDTIGGGEGNDTVYGGKGDDDIYGGAGDDLIGGGAGNDEIYGGSGNDTVFGAAGNDTIGGGKGDDLVFGGDGNDILYGGEGNDTAGFDATGAELKIYALDGGGFSVTDQNGVTDKLYGFEKIMLDGDVFNFADVLDTPPSQPGDPDPEPKPDVITKTFGTLDPAHVSEEGDMYFGDGNTPENYNITTNETQGVQVGLKVHEYRGADITPDSVDADGTAHYTVDAGTSEHRADRGDFSFDFAGATDLNGDGRTTAEINFVLKVDVDPTDGVKYESFDMKDFGPGNNPYINDAGTGGWTDDDGTLATITQNSGNFGFGFLDALIEAQTGQPFDFGEGQFDIAYEAFSGDDLLASTHIVINAVNYDTIL